MMTSFSYTANVRCSVELRNGLHYSLSDCRSQLTGTNQFGAVIFHEAFRLDRASTRDFEMAIAEIPHDDISNNGEKKRKSRWQVII